jgi:hypothetical protein
MLKNNSRNQAKHSSLFQNIKSLFQGKPAIRVTHTHVHHAPKTVRMSDLSPEAKQSFDQFFDSIFSNVQPSKS